MSFVIENRFAGAERLVVAAEARGLDPEVASYYCKLGCVMICGAIERSVEILIIERVSKRSPPQVIAFLKSFFKRGVNYNCDEILRLLYRFDSHWGHKFEVFIAENDKIKSGVASCYAIRNSIAHGGAQSLGPMALRQYYDNSRMLIAAVEQALRQ